VSSGRAESFSDGVFAVAITLLIFNLLTIGSGTLSWHTLGTAWPQYVAYVVSFLSIGIMWMNHHTLFGHVTRIDRPLLVLNLLLLMGIVAIPFPTALVAEHLTGPRSAGGSVAAVVYGVVMIVISLFYNAIWEYLVRHTEVLGARATRQVLRQSVPGFGVRLSGGVKFPRWSIGLIGYLAGALIAAFASPAAGLAVYGLLAVYYLFNHLPDPASIAAPASDGQASASDDAAAGSQSPPPFE
jgi:uncharacterized membrane protein